MGGQAVVEGVMMRGAHTWAVAVRDPDGEIEVDVHDVPTWAERWPKIPLVRGVMDLGRVDGARVQGARLVGRTTRSPRRSGSRPRRWAGRWRSRSIFFTGVFILLPALVRKGVADAFGVTASGSTLSRARSGSRSSSATCSLVGPAQGHQRVFQYHGAEHKAIAAYENDVELTPESAQHVHHRARPVRHQLPAHGDARDDRRVLVRSGRPSLPWLIASRIILIPVIAGLTYEVIRFAAKHMDKRWVRIAMRPGLALQRLTTREPSLDQLEVAIASLRAVMTAEQLAEVEARSAPARGVSPTPRPVFGTA